MKRLLPRLPFRAIMDVLLTLLAEELPSKDKKPHQPHVTVIGVLRCVAYASS